MSLTKSEENRLKYQEIFYQKLLAEDCTPLSEYKNRYSYVNYIYDGKEYKTTPKGWDAGIRNHLKTKHRKTHEEIKELFSKEGCELISEYKNLNTKVIYKYDNKYFSVRPSYLIYHNPLPHIKHYEEKGYDSLSNLLSDLLPQD